MSPAKKVRSLMFQMLRACPRNARYCAPAPGLNASSASAVAIGWSRKVTVVASGQKYRNDGSRRCNCTSSASEVPACWKTSSISVGSVSNDGPVSKVKPSRVRVANLPPRSTLRSSTTTCRPAAARRVAVSNPPTPPPTTATSYRDVM